MVANVSKRTISGGEASFTADCPSGITVDDLVYITGPYIGGLAQVDKVDITNTSTVPAIGIVTQKLTPTRCKVVTSGQVTTVLSLTPGSRYFVGPTGKPTDTVPAPGVGATVAVQAIGIAADTNILIFNPSLLPFIQNG